MDIKINTLRVIRHGLLENHPFSSMISQLEISIYRGIIPVVPHKAVAEVSNIGNL